MTGDRLLCELLAGVLPLAPFADVLCMLGPFVCQLGGGGHTKVTLPQHLLLKVTGFS